MLLGDARFLRCSGDVRNMGVRCDADGVTLRFRVRESGTDEWRPIEQYVPIEWTECNFGGQRPWFCCPVSSGDQRCDRRVALLYGGELFACRQCYRLTYQCQRETQQQRNLSAAQKIRLRLGGSANILEPFPSKQKGMHWRTYERLRARSHSSESLSHKLTLARLASAPSSIQTGYRPIGTSSPRKARAAAARRACRVRGGAEGRPPRPNQQT